MSPWLLQALAKADRSVHRLQSRFRPLASLQQEGKVVPGGRQGQAMVARVTLLRRQGVEGGDGVAVGRLGCLQVAELLLDLADAQASQVRLEVQSRPVA